MSRSILATLATLEVGTLKGIRRRRQDDMKVKRQVLILKPIIVQYVTLLSFANRKHAYVLVIQCELFFINRDQPKGRGLIPENLLIKIIGDPSFESTMIPIC